MRLVLYQFCTVRQARCVAKKKIEVAKELIASDVGITGMRKTFSGYSVGLLSLVSGNP